MKEHKPLNRLKGIDNTLTLSLKKTYFKLYRRNNKTK